MTSEGELLYPVRVLFTGFWKPNDILVFARRRSLLPDEIAQKVELRWQMAELVAKQKCTKLTRGDVRAGRSLYINGNNLCLKYVESDYGNVIGSTYPDVPEEYQDRFVGIMCVTTTSDGYVVYGVRGAIDWAFQCHVAPAGRWSLKQATPAAEIVAEFEEELGVLPAEINNLHCVGVVADETWGRKNFEFVFQANVPLTFVELRQRAFSAKSVNEHVQLLPVRRQDIKNLIMSAPFKWVPTGFAGMALHCNENLYAQSIIAWTPDLGMTYADYMGRANLL